MGYEFSVNVKLTAEEKDELIKLFKRRSDFSSTVTADDEQYFEFKSTSLQSQLPDFTIAFDDKAIYVCQNLTADIWANLDDVKEWLLKQHKDFNVEEL